MASSHTSSLALIKYWTAAIDDEDTINETSLVTTQTEPSDSLCKCSCCCCCSVIGLATRGEKFMDSIYIHVHWVHGEVCSTSIMFKREWKFKRQQDCELWSDASCCWLAYMLQTGHFKYFMKWGYRHQSPTHFFWPIRGVICGIAWLLSARALFFLTDFVRIKPLCSVCVLLTLPSVKQTHRPAALRRWCNLSGVLISWLFTTGLDQYVIFPEISPF